MADLNFKLIPWQQEVIKDQTRFKVINAGRRCGKTRYAAVELILKSLKCPDGCDGVMYIAPTQGQARKLMWKLLHKLGKDVIASSHINNAEITMINGAVIYICGADNPDTLRGPSLFHVIPDEYAFIKKDIFEEIIRPALSDYEGTGTFISSPDFRNHFYDLYQQGDINSETYDSDYKSWHFTTYDNPYIKRKEIEAAKRTLSSFAFKKEFLASFDNAGANIFREEWIKYGEEPAEGSWYIACDLAGFEDVGNDSETSKKRLDKSAIAVVKVTDEGKWFVRKIEYGRWDVRENAVRILKNIREFKPIMIGIERGTTMNAVMPYLTDLMRKNNIYSHIHPLSHNNQSKNDRVIWALQGMFEHGRITLNANGKDAKDSWQSEFLDEYLMFPTKNVHDDLIDGLSYVSQLAITTYAMNDDESEYEPLDIISGI